jgi:hypothetical protein
MPRASKNTLLQIIAGRPVTYPFELTHLIVHEPETVSAAGDQGFTA